MKSKVRRMAPERAQPRVGNRTRSSYFEDRWFGRYVETCKVEGRLMHNSPKMLVLQGK